MKKFLFFLFSLSTTHLLSNAQDCTNWLATPSQPSYVGVGQVNVSGTQITVEATFKRTTPYSGGFLYAGDLVSKHNTPSDVNYLLRPNEAEITTSNGYFRTPVVCEIELNKVYHVAMVYDGTTLKFYRNGFLLSQIAASGNLFQNGWETRIGWYEPQSATTNFIGYTNEVRIWNVARTQAQIRANMTTPLPNPITQAGLLAYYTFDNLINKQGNAAFNGTLGGAASINQTNPNCTLVRDSCGTVLSSDTSVIINTYTPVIAFDNCGNKVVVEDASTFNAGDTVLMIQMKGAVIDSANTIFFGGITDYKNAGNYEMNIVKAKAGNTIELKNTTVRQYDIPLGRVQLIRVPYFQNYVVTDTLTCLPWDGRKGGVLVLNVASTVTMNNDINVSSRGFRGGSGRNPFSLTLTCGENGFAYPASSIRAADKGEGIHEVGFNNAYGKAPNANGGGGGVGHNSGGGGGSNGGEGGWGGYQLEACGNAPFDNRGFGGKTLEYNNTDNKIFLGGGGGSGHTDNAGGIDMNGGNGGGIAIIMTNTLNDNGYKIISNGAAAQACDNALNNCHDGSGGGGAAGSVLIKTNSYASNTAIETTGGKGGDLVIYNTSGAGRIGTGGGGGGGIVWFSQNSIPGNVITNTGGGANGVIPQDNNNNWGATPGTGGQSLFNLQIPVANVLFKPAIDSVRITTAPVSCNRFNFSGLAFLNAGSIQNWQWNFGDNITASTQNSNHTYTTSGTYTVKLIVTDNNGCKDSITTVVNTSTSTTDFSYRQSTCNPLTVQFFNEGNNVTNPSWLFGDGGADIGSLNPTHTYPAQGNYTVQYSVQNGACLDTVTKIISINIINNNIVLTRDTTICVGATKQLLTVPSLSFCWSPTTSLSDPLSPNPITNTTVPVTYYFTAEIEGATIINNGNFNAGNTGFTSGYNFAANNITEGQYFVGTNPQAWNGGLSPCPDHTTGNGNMLFVNGSPVADVTVWQQSVTVTPNTNYSFATWVQALFTPNPAQLSFSINGSDIGGLITASLPTCTWTRFYSTWNSGNNTTAVISIINKNTLVQGNDFALDDISFAPVTIRRDSVKILIDTPVVKTGNDTLVCAGSAVQLTATGANSYSWLPVTGLNNAAISNPIATATDTTAYIVNGTTAFGCTASDTINIFTKPLPVITSIPNAGVCKGDSIQLSTTGGTIYTWSPSTGLSNTGISNPFASPAITTAYIVNSTAGNGCTGADTVTINVNLLPLVKTISDSAVCLGTAIQLTTSGATAYSWLPVTGLSNPSIGSPFTTATDTTQYIVKGTDANNCIAFDTVNIFTRVLPTVVAGNDTLVCAGNNVQLAGTGAATYTWLPITGLSNANIINPIASPADTTQYTVRGTDAFGCSASDSVNIFTKPLPVITSIPNAAVCKGDSIQLSTTGGITYTWLPVTGLSNAGISNPFASPTISTSYIVKGTDNDGCDGTDTVTIRVNPLPLVKTINDSAICLGNNLLLTTSGATTYSWLPVTGLSNPSISNPVTTATDTTQYIVKGTDANNCIAFDTVIIFTRVLPTVLAGNDTIVCSASNVQLSAIGASIYNWLPISGLSNANISNPIAAPADTTKYTVKGTDAFGCSATDSVTIFTQPLPVITITPDTSVCINGVFQLSATGAQRYQWLPTTGLSNAGIRNPFLSLTANAVYYLTATGLNNCTVKDSVKITVKPIPVFSISAGDSTCGNKPVRLSASGGNQYEWSPAQLVSNPGIANPFTNTDNTTIYTVIITESSCQYADTLSTTIIVLPVPDVQVSKSNDIDCSKLTTLLTATGASQYTWSPADALNNINSASPTASPLKTTLYAVTGTGLANKCSFTDTITVFVDKAANQGLFIPSAFSPNNNQLNNCWKATYQGQLTDFSLLVYNRYGELVFSTRDPMKCWDGRYKGKLQNTGNFIYIIRAKNLCREIIKKGNLMLIQ